MNDLIKYCEIYCQEKDFVMRIVIAECSVLYSGRGDTTMGKAIRSIMIKDDGAVSVHNDVSNKPLNYMGKGNVFTESYKETNNNDKAAQGAVTDNNVDSEDLSSQVRVWRFDSRKEYLEVTLYNVIAEFEQELDDGSVPLVRDGTENDLQGWLFANHHVIRDGLTQVKREYQTSAGAIDLMFEKNDGSGLLGVEVKRVAMLGAVDQCVRYRNALKDQHPDKEIEVILTALDVRPNTAKQAEKRGVSYTIAPAGWRNDPYGENIDSSLLGKDSTLENTVETLFDI